ncbi:MAG: C25 family cysteine peptidase [bacterium]
MAPYLFFLIINLTTEISQPDFTLTFSPSLLQSSYTDRGFVFTLSDGEVALPPGAPALPAISVNIITTAKIQLTGIKTVAVEYETLPGAFELAPVPQPTILSQPTPKTIPKDQKIYQQNSPYPEPFSILTGRGFIRGKPIASLLVFPLQLIPEGNRLRLIKKMTLSFEQESLPVQEWAETGPVEYLIVTTRTMDTIFNRLSRWRQAMGFNTAIRSIEWIISSYPGRDEAEKLRNYLRYCAQDSGLKYLLLGGDVDLVPLRKAFAMACSAGLHPREDSLPCDLYYSCLDGNWDADGDGVFGEIEDSVDLYPDISIGRVPANSPEEARAFIEKLIAYESGINSDYQTRALFSAAILWDEPYTDEAIAKDQIARVLPARCFLIHKLYESQMMVTVDTACYLLNQGVGFFNHCGHGWYNALGLARGATIRPQDIDRLTNATRQGIGFSIGCWTTAFDLDAIAEHFLRNPHGGTVAFIGNSSYGWGSPGNPGFGYSDRFDARFFKELFSLPTPRIGDVLARTKLFFVPYSFEANVYRWHQFCLNLLGDPAMLVPTDTLAPLLVRKPSSITPGRNFLWLTVQDNSGPVGGAKVTVSQDSIILNRGKTTTAGILSLSITTTSNSAITITAQAHNHRPLNDSIPVLNKPIPALSDYILITPANETTLLMSPGETYNLILKIINPSTQPTPPVRCSISATTPLITFETYATSIPPLQPESETTITSFILHCSTVARNAQTVDCVLTFTDTSNSISSYPLTLQIGLPILQVTGYFTTFSPPDTVNLFLKLTNTGLATATQPTGTFFLPHPGNTKLRLITPGLIFPDIAPGETVWSLTPSKFTGPTPARLGVNITANGSLISDTLTIVSNLTGIYADFDSGLGAWTTGGENGSWRLSSRRSYSPPFALYAGNETGVYPNQASFWLLSPQFLLPHRAMLRFYRWFSVPIYGADGMYLVIITSNSEDTIDFIGAGGALGSEKMGLSSTWLEERFDLSAYPPGESVRLKFLFVSDNDGRTSEGFYLDDIQVATAESLFYQPPETFGFLRLFPNPCRNRTTIFYALNQTSSISITLFDVGGRMIKTFVHKEQPAGYYALSWDGTDKEGNVVPPGVYFLHLTIPTELRLPAKKITSKLVKR